MTLRVELDEMKRVLILHPVMTLSKVDDNVLGPERIDVLRADLVQDFRIRGAQRRPVLIELLERVHDRLGGERGLELRGAVHQSLVPPQWWTGRVQPLRHAPARIRWRRECVIAGAPPHPFRGGLGLHLLRP